MMVQILGINSEEERKEQKQTARSIFAEISVALQGSIAAHLRLRVRVSHSCNGFAPC